MRIVIYTSGSHDSDELVGGLVDSFSDAARIEQHNSLEELKRRLASFRSIFVLVLYLNDSENLSKLLDLKNSIAPVKTLLILPDGSPETVTYAHQLRPNYIGYVDEPGLLKNVLAVIDHMILSQSR